MAPHRITCSDRIHKLGVAVQSYNLAFNSLPGHNFGSAKRERTEDALATSSSRFAFSAFVALLPYLDEVALSKAIAASEAVPGKPDSEYLTHSRRGAWSVIVNGLVCPSEVNKKKTLVYNEAAGSTNYLVSSGDIPFNWTREAKNAYSDIGVGRGTFKMKKWLSYIDITDGTSNTVMFSERCLGQRNSDVVKETFYAMCWKQGTTEPDPTADGKKPLDFSVVYANVIGNRYVERSIKMGHPFNQSAAKNNQGGKLWHKSDPLSTSFSTIFPPNGPSCMSNYHFAMAATSYHLGGVNVCFADGSVHFISGHINTGDLSLPPVKKGASPYGVWGALGSASGEENINAVF
jgi:prepilin-type processing-associated H-X9-DG protein